MSTKLTLKPGEKVSESGIYQATNSAQRTSLRRGQCAPYTRSFGDEWERVVDANRLRKSPAKSSSKRAFMSLESARSVSDNTPVTIASHNK